jgi:hypothetical protein
MCIRTGRKPANELDLTGRRKVEVCRTLRCRDWKTLDPQDVPSWR